MIASEGSVIAVEIRRKGPRHHGGEYSQIRPLNNVKVVGAVDGGVLQAFPAPDLAFIVVSPKIGGEIKSLLAVNPDMKFVIYTLDFGVLPSLSDLLRENGLERTEAIHIEVTRVNSKNMEEPFPAPWLVSCQRAGLS